MPCPAFLGAGADGPATEPITQAPQTLIIELPAGLHSVTQRFARAEERRNHLNPAALQGPAKRSRAKAYHLRSLSVDNGLSWRGQRWARFMVRLSQGTWRSLRERLSVKSIPRNPTAKQPAPPGHERLAWRTDTLRLNPRPHPRRCRRRPDWPPHAAYGSDRPRAFDRRRCRRATAHASRARSPCRPISR
jgi:hypothetical protein